APSGMAFYTGNMLPAWRGNLFVGALVGQLLARLELDGDKVVKEERLLQGLGERIRDVRDGPDGALWLATDSSSGRFPRTPPEKWGRLFRPPPPAGGAPRAGGGGEPRDRCKTAIIAEEEPN